MALGRNVRGYARTERDEAKLIGIGLNPATIYLEGRGAETLSAVHMRTGEWLFTVGGLRPLGNSRKEIVENLRHIHAAGAAVYDIEARERSDIQGAEMLHRALTRIRGEKTMPPGHAQLMARASAKARAGKRMPVHEARIIYLGLKPEYAVLTIAQKLQLMYGWSKSTAFNHFGGTGVPPGRRPPMDEK